MDFHHSIAKYCSEALIGSFIDRFWNTWQKWRVENAEWRKVGLRLLQLSITTIERCEYYRAPELAFNFPFEVEHMIPKSWQGLDIEENFALACQFDLESFDIVIGN